MGPQLLLWSFLRVLQGVVCQLVIVGSMVLLVVLGRLVWCLWSRCYKWEQVLVGLLVERIQFKYLYAGDPRALKQEHTRPQEEATLLSLTDTDHGDADCGAADLRVALTSQVDALLQDLDVERCRRQQQEEELEEMLQELETQNDRLQQAIENAFENLWGGD